MELTEGLRLVAIAYLLLLALAAALGGMHRSILSFPFYVVYSFVSLIGFALSLGRWRASPLLKGLGSRQRLRLRGLLGELRERRSEEQAMSRGEELGPAVQWTGVSEAARPTDAGIAPLDGPLERSPGLAKDDDGEKSLPTLPEFK